MPKADTPPRILLVDDDVGVLRAYERVLTAFGAAISTATSGQQAVELIRESGPFDAIVSDVSMPEMGGIEFLRTVREHDLDVPVILMTGVPGVDSAMRAIEYGAFRYLAKPVEPRLLQETVRRALTLHEMARVRREAVAIADSGHGAIGDRAGLEARFAMALDLFWMAYQPIVSWRERRVFGYEALLRSGEASLPSPKEFIDAAERLDQVHQLGRPVRARVASDAGRAPPGVKLFVNLHPMDLHDDALFESGHALAEIAGRTVLEITERASLDGISDLPSRVRKLRALGYQIALDDLGAGYAGLTSYAHLEPEVVKIDMSLVRAIDAEPRKQSIVRSMIRLAEELGTLVVAEGIETEKERDTLAAIGCDLMQGYLFAKPQREFAEPRF